jgi:hypothetical protein
MRNRSFFLLMTAGLLGAACGASSPAAAPQVTASATPTPAPAPTPVAFTCPLPALADFGGTCPRLTAQHWQLVDRAIDRVVRDHPEYFNLSNDTGGGSFQVLDRDKYIKAVVAALHAQSVCAREEVEEIQVKTTNDFNEQYNIWASWGHVRRGPGAYITTCFPARF